MVILFEVCTSLIKTCEKQPEWIASTKRRKGIMYFIKMADSFLAVCGS
jgi:hypothetical protein